MSDVPVTVLVFAAIAKVEDEFTVRSFKIPISDCKVTTLPPEIKL